MSGRGRAGRAIAVGALMAVAGCGALFGDASEDNPARLPESEAGTPEAAAIDAPPEPADTGADVDAAAPRGPKRVFVTAGSFPADLGVAAFDAKCNLEAPPGGGAFVAWVSTNLQDAVAKLSADAGLYYTVGSDGGLGPAFNSVTDIVSGNAPRAPLSYNGQGSTVPAGERIWTGTDKNGHHVTDSNCGGWLSNSGGAFGRTGKVGGGDPLWTADTDTPCNADGGAHLICFEQ